MLFFFGFFVFFFGGFKGQVRWPKRATSLGPKPSLFFGCFFWCYFLAFLSLKSPVFPLERAILVVILLCFHLFLFSLFFGLPFSLSLSLSLSCSFLSSLLSVSHFCFWLLLFVFGFVCFFQDVIVFFFFFFSACCLALFWVTILDLFLLSILFSSCCCCFFFVFVAFHILLFLIFGYQSKNISENFGNCKKKKKEKGTFWQEQLAP